MATFTQTVLQSADAKQSGGAAAPIQRPVPRCTERRRSNLGVLQACRWPAHGACGRCEHCCRDNGCAAKTDAATPVAIAVIDPGAVASAQAAAGSQPEAADVMAIHPGDAAAAVSSEAGAESDSSVRPPRPQAEPEALLGPLAAPFGGRAGGLSSYSVAEPASLSGLRLPVPEMAVCQDVQADGKVSLHVHSLGAPPMSTWHGATGATGISAAPSMAAINDAAALNPNAFPYSGFRLPDNPRGLRPEPDFVAAQYLGRQLYAASAADNPELFRHFEIMPHLNNPRNSVRVSRVVNDVKIHASRGPITQHHFSLNGVLSDTDRQCIKAACEEDNPEQLLQALAAPTPEDMGPLLPIIGAYCLEPTKARVTLVPRLRIPSVAPLGESLRCEFHFGDAGFEGVVRERKPYIRLDSTAYGEVESITHAVDSLHSIDLRLLPGAHVELQSLAAQMAAAKYERGLVSAANRQRADAVRAHQAERRPPLLNHKEEKDGKAAPVQNVLASQRRGSQADRPPQDTARGRRTARRARQRAARIRRKRRQRRRRHR